MRLIPGSISLARKKKKEKINEERNKPWECQFYSIPQRTVVQGNQGCTFAIPGNYKTYNQHKIKLLI